MPRQFRNRENYTPAKLACSVVEPATGVDERLNPVIFMHGFSGCKELWGNIPEIVSNRTKRRVYFYDARNHGDSERFPNANFLAFLDDLYYFMDSRNITKAILVGHSGGGYVAGRAALETPERVEMVISEDMKIDQIPGSCINECINFLYLWANAVKQIPAFLDERKAVKYAVDYFYNLVPLDKQKELSKKQNLYNCEHNFNQRPDGRYEIKVNVPGLVNTIRKTEQESIIPEGLRYDGPIYFICGELSPFKVYEHKEDTYKCFPKAEFFMVERATHNVHIDQPDKFTDILLKCILKHQ